MEAGELKYFVIFSNQLEIFSNQLKFFNAFTFTHAHIYCSDAEWVRKFNFAFNAALPISTTRFFHFEIQPSILFNSLI